ncbi:hypothetical protein C6496_20705 [Candidatus Poribacteria bacterium]|nr:MAG: hypothetical protein C6496_20705 [Candidatus Poribacteria bacterium]
MEFRQRYLCVGIGFLFIMFCTVFVLGYEKPIMASSQHTETDPNSEETVTEKPSAPASAPPVKPKEITFELIEGIKFADGTEVTSITKADIEAFRDRPIDMGGNKTDGVTLTKSRNDKIHVRTCREYDAALEDGYYPSSTYDISMASWFKYPCGLLSLLETAAIPQQSFLPTSSEEVFNLELLPLSLFPVVTDFEQTYGYNIENVTYQDRVEKGLLKVTDKGDNWFSCEDEGLRQHLTEVARADFNDDGIEDILLSEAVHATQGTYRTYDLIILTRKLMDGKYEKVEPHDPE